MRVGDDGPRGGESGRGAAGVDNPSGAGGSTVVPNAGALEVEIRTGSLAIEIVTIGCRGDCAELEAVASGGNAPYTYAWDDGAADPKRTLCPDATATFGVTVTDTAIDTEELSYDATSARAEVHATIVACGDAGAPPDAAATCDAAEDLSGDVFGEVRHYAGGQPLPAGRYRVSYAGGCMSYGVVGAWSTHNVLSPNWWLVRETSAEALVVLPGESVWYESTAQCEAANLATAPVEIDFAGGRLGIWLNDYPLDDNIEGEVQNPTWRLTPLAECE